VAGSCQPPTVWGEPLQTSQPSRSSIELETDFFGSRPILLDRRAFRLGADFEELGTRGVDLDETAFWEAFIWDMPLGNRTLDRNIEFLPPRARHTVDYERRLITRGTMDCEEALPVGVGPVAIMERIDRRLQRICDDLVASLGPGEKILLPLSGGLDGRLLATYLVRTGIARERIEVVTFAFDRSSLEYRLASSVSRHLGLGKHHFYEIRRDSYVAHVDDFWGTWRGVLSVLHGHLYGFLKQVKGEYAMVVSGLFGDAVAGFMAHGPGTTGTLWSTSAFAQLERFDRAMSLPSTVRAQIFDDLRVLYDDWKHSSLPIEFDEFMYFRQRQPKTFGPLLASYRRLLPVSTPYLDPELIQLFLSCPFELRREKRVTRALLQRSDAVLARLPDVSSAFSSVNTTTRARRWLSTWSARAAVTMAVLSEDRIRWFTPFATEDVFTAMRRECRTAVLQVLAGLRRAGIMSARQELLFRRKPIHSREAGYHARLLTYLPWIDTM
jgi:asparagine synthetase B (glutamine-hydrolysing)